MTIEMQPSGPVPKVQPRHDITSDIRIKARNDWRGRYAATLAITDLVVIVWAVAGAYVLRYGFESEPLTFAAGTVFADANITYAMLSAVLVAVWWGALAMFDSRQSRILGEGAEEYKRIFRATFLVFGGLAIIAFLMKADVARGFLAVAFPAGLVGLAVSRALCREFLRTRRRAGQAVDRTVVVGTPLHVWHVIEELKEKNEAGYVVVGACIDNAEEEGHAALCGVPVVGDSRDAVDVLKRLDADALIVTSSQSLGPSELQRVGWQLEGTDTELIMSTSLTNIAGPRIHMRPVAGLPLIHVEGPRLPRSGRIVKNTFDRLCALGLIIVLSPVLIAFALAVRLTSPGPALYTQERIGENGRPFQVYKFRSMVQGADSQLHTVVEQEGGTRGPMIKPKNDYRVTPIGRFIRKYSIDELPQLFNVLFGSMSLVGPRPQRAFEVEKYENGAERRLLCKPGMTGFWQVSGRSDMEWDKAVRLDLYYVENWSFTFDLLLLWRTVGVVFKGQGAR